VLLGGVPGVAPGHVTVFGGGVVGTHAAKMAVGIGAEVTVLDKSLARLRELDDLFGGRVRLLYASSHEVERAALQSDLVIGAVLVPGAAAPRLLTHAQIARMQPGAVLVDVAIDQGGCFETSRPTTHADPTYVVDGVVHYCVANMPGAVPRTSTWALNNATLPFTLALAAKGWRKACRDDAHLSHGLSVHEGRLTHEAVGRSLGLPWVPARDVLG
jgi:alanine dehydrogenase